MKVVKPPLPSQDKRWKIIDAKMRKLGYQPRALIETLHAVQESFGYLDEVALGWVAKSLRVPPSRVYGVYAKIKHGDTTPDKQLSLLTVRCMGACGIAPVVVYDGNVVGRLTPEQAIEKLETYLSHAS